MGAFAGIVDPLVAPAEGFYDKYEFIKSPGTGKMFLPVKTIKELFRQFFQNIISNRIALKLIILYI